MKIGISSFVWVSPYAADHIDILYKAKDYGYDVMEIAIEDLSLIDVKQLKKVAREVGLNLSVSGAFGTERDISSEHSSYRKIGLSYIKDCIAIANELESPIFGGPLYSAVGKTRLVSKEQKEMERNFCLENLLEATKYAKEHGVVLALEPLNRFETDMINTVDQALELINEINDPSLKILLDTFHANIEEKSIVNSIHLLGDKLAHVQGNENDRGTPGTGQVDWEGIRDALNQIGYQGSVVLETFGSPSKELARAASIWRPLAESSDILARDGATFYTKIFKNNP
ncbi:xylose isomerase [Sphingobacterium sp. ML3W]|uniref:sugar phosphate isomerase/epimerase family protein n=1 Tax=Sphingobacterium sp. ML3W TaxID=1538644 RepID=UPI0004F8CC3C|nr:sugar phosphate isomerase/epimerase family protein [Sphingobacterium sp. ML3W]AIM36844.1 xylose isomerase [Sphingobacterium sp. ML3W]